MLLDLLFLAVQFALHEIFVLDHADDIVKLKDEAN
jgi:hypothetical protein